jgi:uncharacterized protein
VLDRGYPEWVVMKSKAEYDPAPDMQKIDRPLLLIFGEDDRIVPAERAAQDWRNVMRDNGNKDVTLVVLPGVGHSLVAVRDGASVFPAEYVRAVAEWIAKVKH